MFEHYLPKHRERLKALLEQPDWQETLANVDLERVKAEALNPPSPPSQLTGAAQYLLQRNSERVKQLLGEGVTDEEKLLDAFSDWETALSGDERFPILFLGLVLTLDCSFDPVRCLYCNQAWLPKRMELEIGKRSLRKLPTRPLPTST